MASPYTAGALEARDIAEKTNVNAVDVDSAAALLALIADDSGEIMVGQASFSTTSKIIASTLTAAADFVMVSQVSIGGTAHSVTTTSNTTSITFTTDSTATTFVIQYILGYTA